MLGGFCLRNGKEKEKDGAASCDEDGAVVDEQSWGNLGLEGRKKRNKRCQGRRTMGGSGEVGWEEEEPEEAEGGDAVAEEHCWGAEETEGQRAAMAGE